MQTVVRGHASCSPGAQPAAVSAHQGTLSSKKWYASNSRDKSASVDEQRRFARPGVAVDQSFDVIARQSLNARFRAGWSCPGQSPRWWRPSRRASSV